MLRRLYHEQPNFFEFTPANLAWAKGQISKYPEGRQASAVIPLLWRAQEQEGWLTKPAIEYVADMLGMAYIRVLEVATFYFMFQLQPVGSVAHIQICGTTSCMICGAEDLIAVCKRKIAPHAHELSADGRFSWEEVECLGACSGAPMAQIGKDYYENLTEDLLASLIDDIGAGKVPLPGPQNGRYASEPVTGLTSLTDFESGRTQYNASVQLAVDIGDTVKRIDGTEVPLLTPWLDRTDRNAGAIPAVAPKAETAAPTPGAGVPADKTGVTVQEAPVEPKGKPETTAMPAVGGTATAAPGQPVAKGAPKAEIAALQPKGLTTARDGKADDLQLIEGIGPKLEALCHDLGFFHFDQISNWTAAEIAWVDSNLKGFKGRVTRDKWVAQAKLILEVGRDEFLRRAKTNDY